MFFSNTTTKHPPVLTDDDIPTDPDELATAINKLDHAIRGASQTQRKTEEEITTGAEVVSQLRAASIAVLNGAVADKLHSAQLVYEAVIAKRLGFAKELQANKDLRTRLETRRSRARMPGDGGASQHKGWSRDRAWADHMLSVWSVKGRL